jgi:hypothetical protein
MFHTYSMLWGGDGEEVGPLIERPWLPTGIQGTHPRKGLYPFLNEFF